MSQLRLQKDSPLARMVASALLGIWVGGILIIAIAIPLSFQSVPEAMASPSPAMTKTLKSLGAGTTYLVLREQISESNRNLFRAWGLLQIGLALALFLFLLFGTRIGVTGLGFGLVMLLLALTMGLVLVPQLEAISRLQETNVAPGAAAADQFRWLHRGFTAFEAVVVALGAILFGLLARSGRDGSRRWRFSSGS